MEEFGNNADQRQLQLEGELKFKGRELDSPGEDAQEWGVSQLLYVYIKVDLEKQIFLGIGLVELRGGAVGSRRRSKIMQNGRERKQGEANSQLPPIPEDDDETESKNRRFRQKVTWAFRIGIWPTIALKQ